MPLTIRAPAKVNLHLRVFPVGHDGFHPLRSWFRTVDLFDDLSIEVVEHVNDEAGLELCCTEPSIPTDHANLVRRAWFLHALARAKSPRPDVRASLFKRIPAGAGLGGASSDGAAMVVLADRLPDQSPVGADVLAALAASLGSDVPFFLRHQLEGITDATCTGRGEIVQPFTPGRRHAVLLMTVPGLHVATPAVYARFDELPAPPADGEPDFAAWSHLPAQQLLPRLRNDLEPAAFSLHPELARLRDAAEDQLGRPVRMTGSGSALFTLYDDTDHAAAARDSLAGLPFTPVLA